MAKKETNKEKVERLREEYAQLECKIGACEERQAEIDAEMRTIPGHGELLGIGKMLQYLGR